MPLAMVRAKLSIDERVALLDAWSASEDAATRQTRQCGVRLHESPPRRGYAAGDPIRHIRYFPTPSWTQKRRDLLRVSDHHTQPQRPQAPLLHRPAQCRAHEPGLNPIPLTKQ